MAFNSEIWKPSAPHVNKIKFLSKRLCELMVSLHLLSTKSVTRHKVLINELIKYNFLQLAHSL